MGKTLLFSLIGSFVNEVALQSAGVCIKERNVFVAKAATESAFCELENPSEKARDETGRLKYLLFKAQSGLLFEHDSRPKTACWTSGGHKKKVQLEMSTPAQVCLLLALNK